MKSISIHMADLIGKKSELTKRESKHLTIVAVNGFGVEIFLRIRLTIHCR